MASNPTVLKRYVALELQRLRKAAELERKDVAARLRCAVSHISHLETMRNLPRPPELEVLLGFYGAAERLEAFLELVDAAKKGRDWWLPFKGAAPDWFDLFLGLESAAERIDSYDAMIVPGLFQTPAYAEAVIRAGEPELTDAEVVRRVELRMARQDVLSRQPEPPVVWRVLDESALLRPAGDDPNLLIEQLKHLVTLTELPTVTIQVMPLAAGLHAAAGDGTFTVLRFPSEFLGDPGVVYTESTIGGTYRENPDEITSYSDRLRRVQVQAHGPEHTQAILDQRIDELT